MELILIRLKWIHDLHKFIKYYLVMNVWFHRSHLETKLNILCINKHGSMQSLLTLVCPYAKK